MSIDADIEITRETALIRAANILLLIEKTDMSPQDAGVFAQAANSWATIAQALRHDEVIVAGDQPTRIERRAAAPEGEQG